MELLDQRIVALEKEMADLKVALDDQPRQQVLMTLELQRARLLRRFNLSKDPRLLAALSELDCYVQSLQQQP